MSKHQEQPPEQGALFDSGRKVPDFPDAVSQDSSQKTGEGQGRTPEERQELLAETGGFTVEAASKVAGTGQKAGEFRTDPPYPIRKPRGRKNDGSVDLRTIRPRSRTKS